MDAGVSTAAVTTASPAAPDGRTSPKGGHGHAARFDLALLMQLGAQTELPAQMATLTEPGTQVPDEALPDTGKQRGKKADLLEMLAASGAKGTEPVAADPSTAAMDAIALAAQQIQLPSPVAVALAVAAPQAVPSQPVPDAATMQTADSVAATAPREARRHAVTAAELKSDKAAAIATTAGEEAIKATDTPRPGHTDRDEAAPAPHARELPHNAVGEKSAPREHAGPHDDRPKNDDAQVPAPPTHIKAGGEHFASRGEQALPVDGVRTEPAVSAAAAASSPGPAAPPALTPPNVPHFTAAQAPPPVTAQIPAPFGNNEWADQFRDKVVWVVDRQQQTAELHMNPPHLGPVEVMLTVGDDKTNIAFVSPHPAVREAIEASFSDLRATLEQRGIALGQASVSADSRDAREQAPAQQGQPFHRMSDGGAEADEPRAIRVLRQYGLVDTFA